MIVAILKRNRHCEKRLLLVLEFHTFFFSLVSLLLLILRLFCLNFIIEIARKKKSEWNHILSDFMRFQEHDALLWSYAYNFISKKDTWHRSLSLALSPPSPPLYRSFSRAYFCTWTQPQYQIDRNQSSSLCAPRAKYARRIVQWKDTNNFKWLTAAFLLVSLK